MIVHYLDLQDSKSTLNGLRIEQPETLVTLLEQGRTREPFMFELQGDNGYTLAIGLASDIGSVEHSRSDGDPPYMVTVNPGVVADTADSYMPFLCGGTETPVATRHCVEYELVKRIALDFLETGERSRAVEWEEV